MSKNGFQALNKKSDKLPLPLANNSQVLRILVIDNYEFYQDKLQPLLENEPHYQVTGTVSNTSSALEQIKMCQPDMVLIDIKTPGIDGLEAIREIVKTCCECKILVLTYYNNSQYIRKAIEAGACGYLLKTKLDKELTNAIGTIARGDFYLGRELFAKTLFTADPAKEIPAQKTLETGSIQQNFRQNQLFPQELLERNQYSPEIIGQLMQVVSPKGWLSLYAFGFLIVIAILWSIFGRIPVTVEGRGVIVYPSKVVPLQSKVSGQIVNLNVKEGDLVKKGEIIATVSKIELQQQLELAKNKAIQLEVYKKNADLFQKERSREEIKIIKQKQQNLKKRSQNTRLLISAFKEKIEKYKWLAEQGAIPRDRVLEIKQQYLENINLLNDIKAQLQQLEADEKSIAERNFQALTNRKKEIQEIKREINYLEKQIKNNSQIISPYTGNILEMSVSPGQIISTGTRLANINSKTSSNQLISITYFPVKDGKKIAENMVLQVTPQTVKRERFGGIIGKVTKVSSFPITKQTAEKIVGNSEIVRGLIADKSDGIVQVLATLERDPQTPSGYRWSASQGSQLQITPGTTTVVRVKVEERAPITYVMPILRSMTGIY